MSACKSVILAVAGLALLAVTIATAPPVNAADDSMPERLALACQTPGTWLDPASGKILSSDQLMATLAGRKIVLLGETHTSMEHHRWQLHMLAGLQAHRASLVVGFEMFPRSVQPALDIVQFRIRLKRVEFNSLRQA